MGFGSRSFTSLDVDELYIQSRAYISELAALREFIRTQCSSDSPSLPFFDSDTHLYRFLKVSNHNMKTTEQLLRVHLAQPPWGALPETAHILQHYPHGWHGLCKDGRPVYIECLGKLNISELFGQLSMDDLLNYLLEDTDCSIRLRYPIASLMTGKMVTNSTMIFDLHGVSMSLTDRRVRELIRRVLAQGNANYPECAGRILICRVPRFFSIIWRILKPILPSYVVARTTVCRTFGPLFDWVDAANIPMELGGTSPYSISEGHGPWADEANVKLISSMTLGELERAIVTGRADQLLGYPTKLTRQKTEQLTQKVEKRAENGLSPDEVCESSTSNCPSCQDCCRNEGIVPVLASDAIPEEGAVPDVIVEYPDESDGAVFHVTQQGEEVKALCTFPFCSAAFPA